ncbi:cysteine proteinase [Piedraia hortae CBS 480.64]|uniref:Cysteine proteinase n=1 Tax=Piedraia hortae CBS 480.64 TaxID=1314780 RepID=A0A6A7C1A0_9PEZI|nr:cysteine proteinase [Piedraia hortae CBS 480.64]
MEALQSRHSKERKDLQGQITQKKKSATKKTRKSVNDECERLERELKARHGAELAAFSTSPSQPDLSVEGEENNITDPLDGLFSSNEQPTVEQTPAQQGCDSEQKRKPGMNRAKARLARRAKEQENLIQQAKLEVENLPDHKAAERERMDEYMTERGLVGKDIRPDGHCLYAAIADQLVQLGEGERGFRDIRKIAGRYITAHADEFEPFLEEDVEGYVDKVENTGEWGGQVELIALARALGININVLQDWGRVERFDGNGSKEMWLGYYKFGYGLGEHYNSLRKA